MTEKNVKMSQTNTVRQSGSLRQSESDMRNKIKTLFKSAVGSLSPGAVQSFICAFLSLLFSPPRSGDRDP